jgi:anti-sigma factor RsiW
VSDGTNIPRRELPEHLIDAYVCGDFEGEELAQVEAILARSLELATQVAARQRDREGFASLHPFAPIGAKLLNRQPKRVSGLQTRWALVFAGAAAAVLIGVFFVLPESGSEISVRGGLKATAIVNRDGDVFEHDGQARLHANDRLRIRVEDPIGAT